MVQGSMLPLATEWSPDQPLTPGSYSPHSIHPSGHPRSFQPEHSTLRCESVPPECAGHPEMADWESRLQQLERKVQARERQLEKLQQILANGVVVHINVGGAYFQILRSTLTKYPQSRLAELFSPSGIHMLDIDGDGNLFIDRPPNAFSIILQWLRTGSLPDIPDPTLRSQLENEAAYFGLPLSSTPPQPAAKPVGTGRTSPKIQRPSTRACVETQFPVGSTVKAEGLPNLDGAEGTVTDYVTSVPEGGVEPALHVHVAFRPASVHGTVNVLPRYLKLISPPPHTKETRRSVWDVKRCGRGVVISGTNRDVITGAAGCAIASQGFIKGVNTWRIHVLEGTASAIRVGVCRSGYSQPHLSPWGKAGSWLVAGDGSRWAGYSGQKRSPERMLGAPEGDITGKCIEVTLDCDQHTLVVSVDGVRLSPPDDFTAPAFANLPPELLVPIVSFFQGEVKARLEFPP